MYFIHLLLNILFVTLTASSHGLKSVCKFKICKNFAKILHRRKIFVAHFAKILHIFCKVFEVCLRFI